MPSPYRVSPIRLFFKHTQDVLAGYYTAELKGALTSTTTPWTVAKFLEADRVRKRFLEDFVAAYDSFLIQLNGVDASGGEKQAKEEEEKETAMEEEKKAKADKAKTTTGPRGCQCTVPMPKTG